MSEWLDDLVRTARRFDVELTRTALAQFELFLEEITAASTKMNLISFSDERELAVRHFADSLVCTKFVPQEHIRCIDVGSGAGLPGIPLKIGRPDISMVLLESVGKKAEFLSTVVDRLCMDDTTVVNERAETLGQDDAHRELYDVALSRATAKFAVALEYALPLVRVGGIAIIYQGADVTTESIGEYDAVLKELGGNVTHVEPYSLAPGGRKRTVVRIEKMERTPTDYPRRPGMAKKKPLRQEQKTRKEA